MPSRTHIIDFLILAITFLCIIHSHSSASERHRPIRTTLTLGISHLVSTRKPSHLSAQHPSKIHNKLYISLILIMHDIEINPGPRSPKFPCGICHKAVTSRQSVWGCVRHLRHLASYHLHEHVPYRLHISPQHLMALYIVINPQATSLAPLAPTTHSLHSTSVHPPPTTDSPLHPQQQQKGVLTNLSKSSI